MIFQDPNKPKDYGWKKPVLTLLLVCLAGMAWQQVYGYELPDQFRKWNAESIDVYYNTDGCNISTNGLWHRAARKWDVISVTERGEHKRIGYDERPTLYCAEKDLAALTVLPKDVVYRIDYVRSAVGNLVLASAHSYWINGALLDCDIRLHPDYVRTHNVDKVVLHEMGHCLGVDHSKDPEAAMYWTINNDHSGLHADDLLARCDLYSKCAQWDHQYNLLIQPFQYKGAEKDFKDKCYYGYLIAGGIWPSDVKATETECE